MTLYRNFVHTMEKLRGVKPVRGVAGRKGVLVPRRPVRRERGSDDIPNKVAQPQFTKLLGSSCAFLLPHGCRMLGLVPIPEIADAAQR